MEQAKTAKQIKAEVERFEAMDIFAKLDALEAFRRMIKNAGMYDYGRAGFYVGQQGLVHIYDIDPLSISVCFTSAADMRKANTIRARRDRISRNADR